MKSHKVKDLMVRISEYASIHKNANIKEAIRSIESETNYYNKGPYRHHSLIVIDDNNDVVGLLSQIDIIRALEPRYNMLGDERWFSRSGLSREVLNTLFDSYKLWEQPLEMMYKAMGEMKVEDFMQETTEGEFVSENDSIYDACHRVIMGRHRSLLVTRNRKIVGILRLTDLFNSLCDIMTAYDN
jgi:CBS domain-containing protein